MHVTTHSFPLQPFLESLVHAGFAINIRDYRCIARALSHSGEWNLLRIWLRVMALAAGTSETKMGLLLNTLKDNQALPPYLGAVLKDRQDIETIQHRYKR